MLTAHGIAAAPWNKSDFLAGRAGEIQILISTRSTAFCSSPAPI